MMRYFNIHNHTDLGSNSRFRDSGNAFKSLIINSKKKGLAGVGLTDHGTLSAHPKVCKMMDKNPSFFDHFKVTFGSEIYLVDRNKIKYARDHNIKTRFYHFVLTARNYHGYQLLRYISSQSWSNSFYMYGQRRLPTFKDDLAELMQGYKGDVIASTACLGSELSRDILAKDRKGTVNFLNYLIDNFGKDNVYFEMMPSDHRDQITVNQDLKRLSDTTDIKYIISTDSHYIDKGVQDQHENFLHAENMSRNVTDYYQFARLFTYDELKKYFNPEILETAAQNSLDLLDSIDQINLFEKPEIPKIKIPKFEPVHLAKYQINWHKYPYITDFVTSDYREDCYYISLIFDGMRSRHLPLNHTYLNRINTELHVLEAILKSGVVDTPMSNYFLTMRKLMDLAWQISIVGPGRGSCGCFLINYLLYLNDVDPIKFHLPYWRFLSLERALAGDLPDIDYDTESSQRRAIIELFKNYFGRDHVINFNTFSTLAAKGAIKSACRGYNRKGNRISYLQGQNIVDLLPKENHDDWTIHDAFFGNKKKNRKPAKRLISQVKHYPGLAKAIIYSSGKVVGISQHASGIYISNDPITKHNAMMMTSRGLPVTQYEAYDSSYTGAQKFDNLTIKNYDIIHECIRLLLRDGIWKWYGSFRKTYSHYLSASNMDLNDPKVFDKINEGNILSLFEFSTLVGKDIIKKLKPRTFDELTACNALMRLTIDPHEASIVEKYWGDEQPKDRYDRYKSNIHEWYKDMKDAGLTQSEMNVLKKYLLRFYGVCYGQEVLMEVAMDPNVTDFTPTEANTLRKSIAKKDHKLYAKEQQRFFKRGKKLGASHNFLMYVWYNCAYPAKQYSFNLAHGTAYTITCMIDAVLATYHPTYWKTACLSVNGGIYGEKFENPDYTKLDRAMGGLRDQIINPNINKSAKKFIPHKGKILFGLYPISGIGLDDCDEIISHRPYKSFDDFLNRTNLSDRKVIQLIKSGCFNSFGLKPKSLMISYINHIIPDKKRLTTVQIPKVKSYIPKKYAKMVKLFEFRRSVTGRYKVPMNKLLTDQFFKLYEPRINAKYGKSYQFKNGKLKINIKTFNKLYNRIIKPLKNWLKTDKAIKYESRLRKRKAWVKYCLGNPQSWEMDSLGCYLGTHELNLTSVGRTYHVRDINKLPVSPKIEDWTGFKSHQFPIFEHSFIYGTVVGKNANKTLVYLLTPNGIANVRIGKVRYVKYNKKVTRKLNKKRFLIKDSWFKRGTKLLCLGYKRNNNFFLNKTRTGNQHCLFRIKGYGKHAEVVEY